MDAIHLPVGLTLPSAFGAPAAPLQAGQVIQALVLALIESDIFRLQLPQATIDVRSSVPLTPGSTITLAVKGTGSNTRLAIYADVPSAPSGSLPRGAAPAPNLTGRMPIGEAVVIARTPAGQGAPAAPQSAAVEGSGVASAQPRTTPPAVSRETPVSAPAPAVRPVEALVGTLTPEQAVTEAIQTAAPRQAGLAPLFADLEQIVRAPNAVQAPIPSPVRQAAIDVLSLRVPLDAHLAGADLKQAFVRSGVLLEPRLAAGAVPTDARVTRPVSASASSDGSRHASETSFQDGPKPVPTPRDDLKSALLVFRQVLKVWSASFPATTVPDNPNTPLPAGSQPAMQAPAPMLSSDLEAIRHVASALAGLPEDLSQRAPMSAEQASSLAKSLAAALTRR
ncbi:MAG: hypothetical protein WCE79_15835, partial [Xanthobacteraceae bacterium]